MKKILVLMLIAAATLAAAQSTTQSAPTLSPAERSIAEAQTAIRAHPDQYAGYNQLAAALVRRARETDDATYYAQAADAVKKSLQLSPENFETKKIQASVLFGEHDFPAALDLAKKLNAQVPDDVMVYGLLTDADIELGKYKDAEVAAQWMLNLRPGNTPALLRAATLRELFGDAEGSYELLDMAYQSTPSSESEERAWILVQMGKVRFDSGNIDAAEKILDQALAAFPNYPYALGGLAQVRIAQKRYDEAATLLEQQCKSTSRATHLYDLARAWQLTGRQAAAKHAFAEFEELAQKESSQKNNANLQLVFYYADFAHQPAKALQIARQEYSWRQDVYTLDAYAWALHVNGEDTEARKQIEDALAVGIRDAKLFRHAGEIALKSGDVKTAQRYLKEATDLNTSESEQARLVLERVRGHQ
jgi:tetratricopeptide (TPR) repeat protein